MPALASISLAGLLDLANLLLSSTVAILAFSLLAYVLAYNVRNRVGRAFAILLACVMIVYTGDVLLYLVSPAQTELWLRLQWLGIPFVPAAYFDLSDALLRTTNLVSQRRTRLVLLSYLVGAVLSVLALATNWVVQPGKEANNLYYLHPGPLFLLFVIYFTLVSGYGLFNTYRVRQRCLTPASRRRMTYLFMSFIAPGLGVFPYLVLAGFTVDPGKAFVSLLTLVGNIGVAVMLVVMTYSIAYYGVLSPDRVVKRGLIVFLIRGPLLGILVVGALLTVPKVENILGLPRESVVLLTVVALIVLLQLLIELIKPTVERFIYSHDQEELMAIRELDRRLLTSSDLRQFLENALVSICEYLRLPGGFVAVQTSDDLMIEAACGPADLVTQFRRYPDWPAMLEQATERDPDHAGDNVQYNGYWVWPLRTSGQDHALGVLGVVARPDETGPTEDERLVVEELVERAQTALEDRLLQQGVFAAVMEIMPQIERVQRWRSVTPYPGTPPLHQPADTDSITYELEFTKWVKDALTHYWGGPKLTDSPLLNLKVVGKAAAEEGSPTKGLRAVLAQAIEGLRPEGQRQMAASEWLLYNILDLKFIQGKRVREIADRLAMSESDLYRKQRVAIEQVAQKIMELEANNSDTSSPTRKP